MWNAQINDRAAKNVPLDPPERLLALQWARQTNLFEVMLQRLAVNVQYWGAEHIKITEAAPTLASNLTVVARSIPLLMEP
jgi:hypothetical protein